MLATIGAIASSLENKFIIKNGVPQITPTITDNYNSSVQQNADSYQMNSNSWDDGSAGWKSGSLKVGFPTLEGLLKGKTKLYIESESWFGGNLEYIAASMGAGNAYTRMANASIGRHTTTLDITGVAASGVFPYFSQQCSYPSGSSAVTKVYNMWVE